MGLRSTMGVAEVLQASQEPAVETYEAAPPPDAAGTLYAPREEMRNKKPTTASPAHTKGPAKSEALFAPVVAGASPMNLALPITLPVLATADKKSALSEMNAREVSVCKKCRLATTRTQTVFGEGDVDARIFFIGEGPGENEDLTGRPFVGRAGQLLDKMIAAMGLSREKVFIANIVKCRPPDNRVPAPDEVATCTPYLVRQLEIVRPAVIVTLGLPALKYMLDNPKLTMGASRGQWKVWRGIKLMPTYHPSYVLRAYTEANRQAVWSDLQLVMKEVGLPAKK